MKTKKFLTASAQVIHNKLVAESNCFEISRVVRARFIICDEGEISTQITTQLSEAISRIYNITPKVIKVSGDILTVGGWSPRKASFVPTILNLCIEEINNAGQKIIIANRSAIEHLTSDNNCHFCDINDFNQDNFLMPNQPKESSWGKISIQKATNIVLLRPDLESILAAIYLYYETGGTAKITYLKSSSEFDFSTTYSNYMNIARLCSALGVKRLTSVEVRDWRDFSDTWSNPIYVVPQSLSLIFSHYKISESRRFYVVKEDFDVMMKTNRRNFFVDIDELANVGDNLFRQGHLQDVGLYEAIKTWFNLYKPRLLKEYAVSDGFWRMIKYRHLRDEVTALIEKHKPIIDKKYNNQ